MTEKSMHRTLGDFLPAFKQNTNEINEKTSGGCSIELDCAAESAVGAYNLYEILCK